MEDYELGLFLPLGRWNSEVNESGETDTLRAKMPLDVPRTLEMKEQDREDGALAQQGEGPVSLPHDVVGQGKGGGKGESYCCFGM